MPFSNTPFLPKCFLESKGNYGGHRHSPEEKNKIKNIINTNPRHPAIIYIFFIWFFYRLRCEKLLKIHIMQKQLRIITSRHLSVCPVSRQFHQVPAIESSFFSRHFRRRQVNHRPLPGTSVYHIMPSGWYIWCFPSGRRQFAVLPF